jgi:hypothetical protein
VIGIPDGKRLQTGPRRELILKPGQGLKGDGYGSGAFLVPLPFGPEMLHGKIRRGEGEVRRARGDGASRVRIAPGLGPGGGRHPRFVEEPQVAHEEAKLILEPLQGSKTATFLPDEPGKGRKGGDGRREGILRIRPRPFQLPKLPKLRLQVPDAGLQGSSTLGIGVLQGLPKGPRLTFQGPDQALPSRPGRRGRLPELLLQEDDAIGQVLGLSQALRALATGSFREGEDLLRSGQQPEGCAGPDGFQDLGPAGFHRVGKSQGTGIGQGLGQGGHPWQEPK